MSEFWNDLRHGAKVLAKTPGFTLVVLVILALGIGANTLIFSIVNAVLLRPLPYLESERMIHVGRTFPNTNEITDLSQAKYIFLRDNAQSFESIAAIQELGSNTYLADENDAEFVRGLRVSFDFFRVMGVQLPLGRGFTPEEDSPAGQDVVVLSDALWRNRFGARTDVVGGAIALNGVTRTVVGIMPPSFEFIVPADVFVPMQVNPSNQNQGHNYTIIGRLKREVTIDQARAELKYLFDGFKAAHPEWVGEDEMFGAMTWRLSMTANVRALLWILFGAVVFVLLIACANIINLQLARATARRKEMAIRMALGGGSWRLIRQLLTESLLLAFAGGALGYLLAKQGSYIILRLIPDGVIPRTSEINLDWRVLAFTLGASLVTGIIFGLAPAPQTLRLDLNHLLKEETGKGRGGGARALFSGALVVAEVALALALTIGAGLLFRTFANLSSVEPGFDAQNVLTFEILPRGASYDTVAKLNDLYRRILEQLSALPGVRGAAVINKLPLDSQFNMPHMLAGQTKPSGSSQYRLISPDYFKVMRMTLKQGRGFEDTDQPGSEPVVIVNEAFARQNFKERNPIGQEIFVCCERGDLAMRRIVGVVNETKQRNLSEEPPAAVFIPVAQASESVRQVMQQASFVLRAEAAPQLLADAVRREVRRISPTIPIRNIRPLESLVTRAIAPQRFNLILVGSFSALGIALAAIGIYGVIAYGVSQRTDEIGLRMALGAQSSDVLKLIVKQAMTLTAIGMAIGLIGSAALTKLMASMLFGVSPTDKLTFALVSAAIAIIALLACGIPTWRAIRVDPLVALRHK